MLLFNTVLFTNYPKRIEVGLPGGALFFHTSLHCTALLLGQTGLGMIQGCHKNVEMALDLICTQLVIDVNPGGKKSVFLSIS